MGDNLSKLIIANLGPVRQVARRRDCRLALAAEQVEQALDLPPPFFSWGAEEGIGMKNDELMTRLDEVFGRVDDVLSGLERLREWHDEPDECYAILERMRREANWQDPESAMAVVTEGPVRDALQATRSPAEIAQAAPVRGPTAHHAVMRPAQVLLIELGIVPGRRETREEFRRRLRFGLRPPLRHRPNRPLVDVNTPP